MAAPTEPEAIPADVLEDAKSLGALVRDWMTGPAPLAGGKLEQVIALRLQRLADRASRAPVDGAEEKPVAWRWHGPRGGWIYDDERPRWWSEPVYAHPAPAPPDAGMVEEGRRIARLETAAQFLLWARDSGKNVDDAREAWDTLRAALSKHEGPRS